MASLGFAAPLLRLVHALAWNAGNGRPLSCEQVHKDFGESPRETGAVQPQIACAGKEPQDPRERPEAAEEYDRDPHRRTASLITD